MNRPPGPNDRWWSQHAAECNGTYVKVKEPKKENGKENKKRLPSASATYFGSEWFRHLVFSCTNAPDLIYTQNFHYFKRCLIGTK